MVAAGNGACDREHWRRDNRVQLRPRGGRDDDLADQRATAPARSGAGGAAGHARRPRGRRGQRGQGDERRPAAGGHRERGRVLPAAGQDQDAGPDGGADLGQDQQRRRRPRAVLRGVRQPHARTRRAGRRPAELGHGRRHLPVAAAGVGRRTGGHQPGLARHHVRGGGRAGARPLASARRRVPAAARRLGRVQRPRRGGDQLLRRRAGHDRRRLAARPHRERALIRRARSPIRAWPGSSTTGNLSRRRRRAGAARTADAGHGEPARHAATQATPAQARHRQPSGRVEARPGDRRGRRPRPATPRSRRPGQRGPAGAGRGGRGRRAGPRRAKLPGTDSAASVPGLSGARRPPGAPYSGGAVATGRTATSLERSRREPPPSLPPRRVRRRDSGRRRRALRPRLLRAPRELGGQATRPTPRDQGPAGVHQPGRAGRDRRAAAVRRAGGGDDRAGDRGVRLGPQRARGAVPQPVRHQGDRARGQREPADLGVPGRPVGDDRRAVPGVPQRRGVDRRPRRAARHQRLLHAGDGRPRRARRVRQRPDRRVRDRSGLRREPHRADEAVQPVPVRQRRRRRPQPSCRPTATAAPTATASPGAPCRRQRPARRRPRQPSPGPQRTGPPAPPRTTGTAPLRRPLPRDRAMLGEARRHQRRGTSRRRTSGRHGGHGARPGVRRLAALAPVSARPCIPGRRRAALLPRRPVGAPPSVPGVATSSGIVTTARVTPRPPPGDQPGTRRSCRTP